MPGKRVVETEPADPLHVLLAFQRKEQSLSRIALKGRRNHEQLSRQPLVLANVPAFGAEWFGGSPCCRPPHPLRRRWRFAKSRLAGFRDTRSSSRNRAGLPCQISIHR